MMSTDRNVFDFGMLASRYDRWYETPAGKALDRVQKEDVRRLLGRASSGERLLDVGCGTGHWSFFFANLGYQVTGIDIAREMIAVARSVPSGCSFQVADARELPFKDASFDVVAMMAALEFLTDPEMGLREMARCAKPGGILLIGTLNRLAPLNRQRISANKEPYASGHLFSPAELRIIMKPYGRIRMTASSIRSQASHSTLSSRIPERMTGRRTRLQGPFLVAEVRR